ncbi:MAG: hypothetical protein HRT59_26155 [Crocosphaera sp.]|nr:hypothetical protein [Crocosphaera sp.]
MTETDELTFSEERDRLHLERKVERAFYEAGKALQELRDRRLYRSTHKTFERYCRERFGYNRSRSYQLIDAGMVVDNLQKCPQFVDIFPTKESLVRPLASLNPSQQVEVWTKAVELVNGQVPPARVVKNIVDQIRERSPVPNPWRKGEVCMILVKDNPDLRGKGGCWCVITEVHNFSCTVSLWDGDYQVKPENLKELPYSNEQQEEVRKLCARLSKIYSPEMEDTAKAVLASLGRIDRPWLTDIEESLLALLEEKMKQ